MFSSPPCSGKSSTYSLLRSDFSLATLPLPLPGIPVASAQSPSRSVHRPGELKIDDKMKEALQIDCTQYAPGVEIIGVRVTKPNIPAAIKRNFELMEEERTKALISIEAQKVAEKEAETKKKIALSEAEKNAQVSKILMEQKLMEKDSLKQQEAIENEMYVAREKSQADASFYRVLREAEANKLKLTPEFLELKFIEAIANNSKIFFGDKIPNMVFDQRILGNFLNGFPKQEL